MIYVVLGMHKSGTTLVSQLLHASGINMGNFNTDLSYNRGNVYERHETQDINRDLLRGYLIPPLGTMLKRPRYDKAGYKFNSDSLAIVRYSSFMNTFPLKSEERRMMKVITDCEQKYKDWGFKDPRTCITYPCWKKVLPNHRVIVVFRSCSQLLSRYKLRGLGRFNLPKLFRLMHTWTIYNYSVITSIEKSGTSVLVVSYEELMNGETELERLSKFVRKPLIDMRDSLKYRKRSPQITRLPFLVYPLLPLLPANPQYIYNTLNNMRV